MSPSGAELLRRVKSQIAEVDPSEVNELIHEGATVVDVREAEEYAAGHLPGAKHVPRSYLESRIEAAVPDRSTARCAAIRAGSSAMIRRRSSGENFAQPSISARLRPQPRQFLDPRSSTQTLIHGVSISAMPAAFPDTRRNIKRADCAC